VNNSNPAEPGDISAKLVNLESLIAHVQYELEQLNAVIIDQNQRIEQLSSTQTKFKHQLQTMSEELDQRNPEEERPPHY